MTEERREEVQRDYAEKIITNEYRALVISMIDEEGEIYNYYDGSLVMAIGLVESMKSDLLRQLNMRDE